MSSRWRVLVLVALVGAPLAACSDDGPGEGEARLEVNGEALIERADGDRETIDDSTDLAEGDRVTLTEGVGVMRLHGGSTFELRASQEQEDASAEDADTQVLMGSTPVLEAGDLLVAAPESTTVEADGTEVHVREGAARLTRAFGMSAAAYDADLLLDSAGIDVDVRSLRQVVVPDLGRPRPARPVDYDDADPWDVRYLGGAMDFGRELEVMAERLTGMLPEGEGRTVGFLRLVLPGLEDEDALDEALMKAADPDRTRKPGDNVVGAAITDLGERGSFEDRWKAVFTFREEGAAWGIVALDQAVRGEPLIGSVEQAFNSSFDEIAQGPTVGPSGGDEPTSTDTGGSEEPVSSGDGGTDGSTDGGTDGGGGGGAPVPPTTTPTLPPPLTPPPDSEPPAELDPIVDPVVDLADDLLGGLLG